MNRKEIKEQAKKLIKGNLWVVFRAILIITLISLVIECIPMLLGIKIYVKETVELFGENIEVESLTAFGEFWSFITSMISLILNLGLVNYVLKFVRGKTPKIEDIFNVIKKHWKVSIIVSLLTSIIISIGSILLVIPGIIASLGLTLCNYIIIDNKELGPKEVLMKSWKMMDGHKWEFLGYTLSFIGWMLLCVFIVPIYFVIPYMEVTFALFYEGLKKAE